MTQLLETPAPLPRLDDDALSALFTDARTANSFTDEPVGDAELSRIWELARWAPTAANFQPLRVVFVRSGAGRDRLVGHMSEGNKAKTASAPAVAVLAMDTRFFEHLPTVMPPMADRQEFFATNADKAVEAASYNAALQSGYFILAVRALGLAAGPMGGFDAAALDADFFPDGRWRSHLVVNIGHPGSDAFRSRMPRLDHDEAVRWV